MATKAARKAGAAPKKQDEMLTPKDLREESILAVKQLGRKELMRSMASVLTLPIHHVQVLAKDQYASGALSLMASLMVKAVKTGNPKTASFFMSYMVGMPEKYDPSIDDEENDISLAAQNVSSEMLVALVKNMLSDKAKDDNRGAASAES